MIKTADEYRNLASHAHHELQYKPADWGTGTRTVLREAASAFNVLATIGAPRRPFSPAADALLNIETPVLDHGLIMPVDYMGTDNEIVQSARVTQGPSAKPMHDDRGLIRYMFRHRHTTPFEMCEVRFKCRMPIFVARQWIRHRTAVVNEMSLRYSDPLACYYVPSAADVAGQSTTNKQGRSVALEPDLAETVRALITAHESVSEALYDRLANDLGVAKELARSVLPVALYTEWIWKIDLHNLLHFLTLRLDPHAQLEIRVYAQAMAEFVRQWVPLTWEAFEEYRLYATTFGRTESRALVVIFQDALKGPFDVRSAGVRVGLAGRELDEFEAKVLRLREVGQDRTLADGGAP